MVPASRLFGAPTICLLALASRNARGDGSATSGAGELAFVRPPEPGHSFVQYGVAFTVEGVASPGPICAPNVPCILGSGAGIVARAGWRPTEALYLGGAYEFSKQDPNNLYRLGLLQQVRGEIRLYFPNGTQTTPFVTSGAGLAAYGDEWSVGTWGATAAIGGGLELELSGAVHLGLALVYRPIYFRAWVYPSTIPHEAGFAHLVGLELALEAQDRLGETSVRLFR
ncbi:MAG: hypothetical protein ABSC94_02925 [Polyangiaceae bacterium]